MSDATEFAEQYTRAERVRLVVLGIVIGGIVVGAGKLWFFPWLHSFVESAMCRTVFGISGMTVLLFGVFVGLPSCSAMLVAATVGRRGYRIVRGGQVPPHGEKVFRRTKIQRGAKAKVIGFLHALPVIALLALSAWGYVEAARLSDEAGRRPLKVCGAALPSQTGNP